MKPKRAAEKATKNQLLGLLRIAIFGIRLSIIGGLVTLASKHDLMPYRHKQVEQSNHDPNSKDILPTPS